MIPARVTGNTSESYCDTILQIKPRIGSLVLSFDGNEIFSNEDLKDSFELSEGSFFSFLRNDNAYSKEKLTGDIESLESFYKNRGYIKFSVESAQVSLSKDYKDIFIKQLIKPKKAASA